MPICFHRKVEAKKWFGVTFCGSRFSRKNVASPPKKKETQNRKKPSERQQKDCGINRGAVAGLNWFLCQRSEGKSRESKTSFREYKTIVRKDGQIVYLQKKERDKKGLQGQPLLRGSLLWPGGQRNDVLFSAGSTKLNIL